MVFDGLGLLLEKCFIRAVFVVIFEPYIFQNSLKKDKNRILQKFYCFELCLTSDCAVELLQQEGKEREGFSDYVKKQKKPIRRVPNYLLKFVVFLVLVRAK